MLIKLLKYEFKSQAKIMVTFIVGILIMAVMMTVIFNVNMRITGGNIWRDGSTSEEIFGIVTTILGMLCIVALAAVALSSVVILAHRFYKNLFSNEGYLSFTLPASSDSQLLAKIIPSLVWLILVISTGAVSVFGFCTFGTSTEELINQTFIENIQLEFMNTFYNFRTYGYETRLVIEAIATPIMLLLLLIMSLYLAITIGSTVSKFKLLASAGAFFGINVIFFSSWVLLLKYCYSQIGYYKLLNHSIWYLEFELLSAIILSLILCIGCYFTMKLLIDKKLNLP